MSEYIKLEDVKELIRTEWVKYMPSELDMNVSFVLGKMSGLPTIEVNEDCISREWLEEQLQKIEDITAMAHIDLGEDPYDETEEITMPISTVRKIFKDAPSVVPQPKEGEWQWKSEDVCDNCGYEIPHLERIVGETVLMDSKDWNYCPNCGCAMTNCNK